MSRTLAALLLSLSLLPILATPAVAQQATKVAVTAVEVVYDPVGGKLYASVPTTASTYPNCVVEVDPATGLVTRSVYVGSSPRRMAISDDGRYLYVGIDGAYAIRRVELSSMTAGLQFVVGSSSSGPVLAYDIAVVPDDPSSVAVVRAASASASSDDGVAVYTDGVMLAAKTTSGTGPRSIAFGSSSRLYGHNKTASYEFLRLDVDVNGVTPVDSTRGLISGSRGIVYSGGRVYAGSGEIIDPVSLTPIGTLPAFEDYAPMIVEDVAGGRILTLSSSSPLFIRAFDRGTLQVQWAAAVPGSGTAVSFVRAGSNRVAYTTTAGDLYLAGLAGSSVLRVLKTGLGNGTVTSTPAGIKCGDRCDALVQSSSTVTLAVTADTGARFVRWEGDADCADGTVTVSGPITCRAVFERTNTTLDVPLPIFANDIVYSGGTLYASVPGTQSLYGNGIAAIDPATGVLKDWLFVGSEPNKLALADDGTTLYVGLDGARAVRRIDLATMTAGLQFPVRAVGTVMLPVVAGQLAVLPGDPASVAVSNASGGSANQGVAIYTDGVRRPATVPSSSGGNWLAFSSSADRLYGLDGSSLVRMTVSASGVSVQDTTRYLLSSGLNLVFSGGRLYAGSRHVWPETLDLAGTLPPFPDGAALSAVAVDGAAGRLYTVADSPYRLRAFDAALLRPLWSVGISGRAGALVQAGTNGFAYPAVSDKRLHLVLTTGTHTLTVRVAGTGGGTVTHSASGNQLRHRVPGAGARRGEHHADRHTVHRLAFRGVAGGRGLQRRCRDDDRSEKLHGPSLRS